MEQPIYKKKYLYHAFQQDKGITYPMNYSCYRNSVNPFSISSMATVPPHILYTY